MRIQLSDHFDYKRLLRFTLPSIVMMIFTSIYSVVDGIFISNFVGTTPFAAINLIFPFLQILGCVGFMFGAGGSALVSMTLGEGDSLRANRIFSLLIYVGLGVGVVFAALGCMFIEPIAVLMGADEALLPLCVTYGRIILLALPAFMIQNMLQSFLITAEKPKLGLGVTVAAGVTNMVLDALFIAVFRWELVGAAAATATAQLVGGVIPFVYFLRKNNSLLHLGKAHFDGRALLRTCTNGASELVTNISMSVVSMLYNFQLMRFEGEDGVAAYGAVMYVGFIFVAIFIGYSIGSAPVIGYHHGARNHGELKSLFRKSNALILVSGAVLAVLALVLASPLAHLFVRGGSERLVEMTVTAFRFYSISVIFSGVNIFGSSFFTALGDGAVSATISFLRMFAFQAVSVLVLPIFFEVNGIWYSLFLAEILSVIVTAVFYITKRKKYKY